MTMRRISILLLLCASMANAALTTVTDTVYRADGSLATGTINIAWQNFRNASGQFVAAGNIRSLPIIAGVFTVALEPNIGASPNGTSYVVVYQINGAPTTSWRWYVPVSASPVGLSVVQFPATGLVGNSASVNPTQLQQGGATVGQAMCWLGTRWGAGSCGGGGGGSSAFSALTAGTNATAAMLVGSGSSLGYAGSGTVSANQLLGNAITGVSGTSGKVLEVTGVLTTGQLLVSDVGGNAVDSGIPAASVILSYGSYANPTWLTSIIGTKITGTVGCAQQPALSGDATTVAGTCAVTVTKTGGVSFANSATLDTTVASNITSGTLSTARLPVIDLSLTGAGGVTGNLQIASFNGGIGASSTKAWFGDGTWKDATGGTVTNTLGSLAAGRLLVGNSGNDITALTTLGTSVQVLHGNAGGTPTWSAVVLTTDVSGLLATANGGLNSASIAFSGPSGGAKTFALPNASSTILTSDSPVSLAQGGTGANLSAIAKGGIIVGTAANTVAVKAIGTDGFVLVADSASVGGVKWDTAASGTGTVTNIATTAPIAGGPITATGTITCPTCVTSAAALTANRLVIGGGLQASAALGSLGTTTTLLHGNAAGAPSFAAVSMTADVSGTLPLANGGTNGTDAAVNGAMVWVNATGYKVSAAMTAHGVVIAGGASVAPASTSAGTSLQVLMSNGASADPSFASVTTACPTCVTSAASLTNNAMVTGAGTQGSKTPSATTTLDTSGNISTPGSVTTGAGGANSGAMYLAGVTSGGSGFAVPNVAGTAILYMMPVTNGTSGQVLSDGGSGTCGTYASGIGLPTLCHQLAWITGGGGGGGTPGSPVNSVQRNVAGVFTGQAMIFNGSGVLTSTQYGTEFANITYTVAGNLTLPALVGPYTVTLQPAVSCNTWFNSSTITIATTFTGGTGGIWGQLYHGSTAIGPLIDLTQTSGIFIPDTPGRACDGASTNDLKFIFSGDLSHNLNGYSGGAVKVKVSGSISE